MSGSSRKRKAAVRNSAASKPAPEPRTKQEQREATRRLLLQIARELFSEHGYAGTGTEAIVKRAQVTRGALYHQFADKQDLFRAVFIEAQQEIVAAIGAVVESAPDGWRALVDGCKAFLSAAAGPGLHRIVMLDGPAVLGLEEWRRLDSQHSFEELKIGVQAAIDAGDLPRLPAEALAVLLSGAMNEGALYVATAENQTRALHDAQISMEAMLEALRTRACGRFADPRAPDNGA